MSVNVGGRERGGAIGASVAAYVGCECECECECEGRGERGAIRFERGGVRWGVSVSVNVGVNVNVAREGCHRGRAGRRHRLAGV